MLPRDLGTSLLPFDNTVDDLRVDEFAETLSRLRAGVTVTVC